MAIAHQLACECGATLLVEPRQAGKTLPCECGRSVDVPALRQLKELPEADSELETSGAPSNWGARQATLTGGLLLAAGLLLGAFYFWVTQPPTPPPFDPQARESEVAQGLETWTPKQAWDSWSRHYRFAADTGGTEYTSAQLEAIEARIATLGGYQLTLIASAAGVMLASLAIYFSMKPNIP